MQAPAPAAGLNRGGHTGQTAGHASHPGGRVGGRGAFGGGRGRGGRFGHPTRGGGRFAHLNRDAANHAGQTKREREAQAAGSGIFHPEDGHELSFAEKGAFLAEGKCFNCGEQGHMERDCKAPPKPYPDRKKLYPRY